MVPNYPAAGAPPPLVLNGRKDVKLVSVKVAGEALFFGGEVLGPPWLRQAAGGGHRGAPPAAAAAESSGAASTPPAGAPVPASGYAVTDKTLTLLAPPVGRYELEVWP
jgi:hypothetical protein